MADAFPALTKTTTGSSGTGTITLSLVANPEPFRNTEQANDDGSLPTGSTVLYTLWDTTVLGDASFELGFGVFTIVDPSTHTISRLASQVLDGSNGPGVLVSFPVTGSRDVYIQAMHPNKPTTFGEDITFVKQVIIGGNTQMSGDLNVVVGEVSIDNGLLRITPTRTTVDPTTTEYPLTRQIGVHENTTSGNRFFVWNDGGTIFKVLLT